MIYDFDKIEEKKIPNFKGGEKYARVRMAGDDKSKILYGILEPGCSIGVHTHHGEAEIVYALKGQVSVFMDGKEEILKAGECHYCPDGHTHGMKNISDTDFEMIAVLPNYGDDTKNSD